MSLVYRSPVVGDSDPNLGDIFPTYIPDPERLVYEMVRSAVGSFILFPDQPGWGIRLPATFKNPPLLSFYGDQRETQRSIEVVRGWPEYPGVVPAIGVQIGNESEDDQYIGISASFAGERTAVDDDGELLGTADYWSQPLYSPVIVELIHENRDERDRLHNELRRVLFPLARRLPMRDALIKRVRVDAEKQELPMEDQPRPIYVSVFTVHVYYEMLEAANVIGPDGIITSVTPTVVPS